jgi:hypothetical protein
MMKWLSLILLVHTSAAIAQDPFCTQLRSVADQASDGFRNLRGALDATESYRSAYAFPGANSCRISESPYTYEFRCSWRYEADEWDIALADAKSLADEVAICFGKRATDLDREPVSEDDSIRWTSRLGWAGNRLSFEIGANSFVSRSRSLGDRRLTSSSLTVRYRRQARRD